MKSVDLELKRSYAEHLLSHRERVKLGRILDRINKINITKNGAGI